MAEIGVNLFQDRPFSGRSIKTLEDAFDLPQFKMIYEANVDTCSANACAKNSELAEYWAKEVYHQGINCEADQPVDTNFFANVFGMTDIPVDAREIFNSYRENEDNWTLYFETAVAATAVNTDIVVPILRHNHTTDGKYSNGAKGWLITDPDTNVWFSIEDKDDAVDFNHKLTLRPLSGTVIASVKKHKKYNIVPARAVGGYSCPLPINTFPGVGYVQSIKPLRLRVDTSVKIDVLRGYDRVPRLRWSLMYDTNGNAYDAWDLYEAAQARINLNLALNMYAFLGTPITNAAAINGVGVTKVDSSHPGFFGYLPSLRYAGGNILDVDVSKGLDFVADYEPFILQQDALKRTKNWNVKVGLDLWARMQRNWPDVVKRSGIGADQFPAFERNGGTLRRIELDAYEFLGARLMFSQWDVLSDSRLLGSPQMSNTGIMTPMDGVQDADGRNVPAIEFFQYGGPGRRETGGYWEETRDMRPITACEEINFSAARSIMMAVHCPGRHILINPTNIC